MIGRSVCLVFVCLVSVPLAATGQGLNTSAIEQALGRSGQKAGDIYRVGFPRTDLHVVVQGVSVKPGLALGSWAAFSGTDENATVMGDLVLLDSEVNPVMEKLRSAGFEITAVHHHLLGETPNVMYMHYMGHGSAARIAGSLKAALTVSKTPLEKPAALGPEPATPPDWVKKANDTIGRQGAFRGGVLSFGLVRAEAITENGRTLTSPQGAAESINFQEAGVDKVATTGDSCLQPTKSTPSFQRLRNILFLSRRYTATCLPSSLACFSCTAGLTTLRRQSRLELRQP